MSLKGPILIIEDDEDDQYLIGQAMEQLGVTNQVQFLPNGQAALEYLEITTEQPFLILCDINMPIMNGLELRRLINQSLYLSTKSIPFIYLTTAASPDLVRQAYEFTVQGFYQKAPDFAHLREQIKLIVDYWTACRHPNNVT